MSAAAKATGREALRRGWCPGAWHPMRTGDGLLVRLRLTGGILPSGRARALADAADAFGNGLLDLSGRANLQLRGVSDETLPALLDRLADLGLLDEDPAAESVRNIMASPLAGLSRAALLDIRPLVQALEQSLVAEPDLRTLPGKFGFLIDDGGEPSLADVATDIGFFAARGPGGVGFAIRLAGDAAAGPAAFCAPEELADAALRLARAFLALRATRPVPPRRMAALVRDIGADAVREAAGLAKQPADIALPERPVTAPFGIVPTAGGVALGLGAPFGRWTSDALRDLAALAEAEGSGELRLSPFRAILVTGVAADRAPALLAARSGRFIVSADDPRLALAACTGAPACGNATTSTHEDALALLDVATAQGAGGVAVHVSGCIKGCAHPGPTPVTLVGRDGRYDLVIGGTAADAPALQDLTIEEAVRALAAPRPGKGAGA